MKVRFGLRLKFTLLFVGMLLVVAGVVRFFLKDTNNFLTDNYYRNYAVSIAGIIKGMVEEERITRYAESKERDADYEILIEQAKQLLNDSEVFYLYVVAVSTEEQGVYIFDLKQQGNEVIENNRLGQDTPLKKKYPHLKEVLDSKAPSITLDHVVLENGERLVSVYDPILNDEEEVTAFVGVDIDEYEIDYAQTRALYDSMSALGAGLLLCLIAMLFIVQFTILRPIYQLKDLTKQVEQGIYKTEYKIKGHDELSEILAVFQKMLKSIAGNMEEMQTFNEAYSKYIPERFPMLLGKDSIIEVSLGDEVSVQMAVLSFQLADFQRSIRKKSTKEMIASINRVLRVCIPAVLERSGTVEDFHDAGFTALFDQEYSMAIESAIAMCRKLNYMEEQKQIEKNRAGIGITYGPVSVGIVGQEKRMEAITVSQYRDTAEWLQKIAEQYQAHILITENAALQIPAFFVVYHTRLLGFLYNPYTDYTDRIYDVYDGDSREEIELKDVTKDLFEEGVELYCTGDYMGARRQFIEVLKVFHRDKAAKEYVYLCDRQMKTGKQEKADVYFTRME